MSSVLFDEIYIFKKPLRESLQSLAEAWTLEAFWILCFLE